MRWYFFSVFLYRKNYNEKIDFPPRMHTYIIHKKSECVYVCNFPPCFPAFDVKKSIAVHVLVVDKSALLNRSEMEMSLS